MGKGTQVGLEKKKVTIPGISALLLILCWFFLSLSCLCYGLCTGVWIETFYCLSTNSGSAWTRDTTREMKERFLVFVRLHLLNWRRGYSADGGG